MGDASSRGASRQPGPATAAAGTLKVLEALDVSKSYGGIHALRNVNFTLHSHEAHALVGDNGAGKSTLAKIFAGAIMPTSGEILVDGKPVNLHSPVDAFSLGISTVHQTLALVGVRNIAENIFLGREPTRLGFVRRRFMHDTAREIITSLKQMNVTDTHVMVSSLSGGQRQAVAIAREVALGSRILILDEPTAALGVRETQQVLNVIADLKEQGRSMIIISHNLAHVFRIADRITVLRAGRAVASVVTRDVNHEDVVKMITGAEYP